MSDENRETEASSEVSSLSEIDARDDALIAEVDATMLRAARAAGDRWRCGPGRTDCCIGPFPIDALDARRLARGLERLEIEDPERARAIRSRAAAAVEELREDFPGDPDTGILGGDVDDLLDACDWHEDLPCPALDPDTGRCEVYPWRPLVCRTFGPPLRVHEERWKACPYCFSGRSPKVELDRENRFGQLRAELYEVLERSAESAAGAITGETFVAFALLDPAARRQPR